jgi:hypothetical protein
MSTRGTATPMPILAPEERPLDDWPGEGEVLGEVFGLGDEPGEDVDVVLVELPLLGIPITFVMAADLLSVNVDVYAAAPEAIVLVTTNVVKTAVSCAAKTTVAVPSSPSG